MGVSHKELEAAFEKMVMAVVAPPYLARLRPPINWASESGRTKTRIVSYKDSPLCDPHVVDFVVYHIESFLDSNKSMPYKLDMKTEEEDQTVILRFQVE